MAISCGDMDGDIEGGREGVTDGACVGSREDGRNEGCDGVRLEDGELEGRTEGN